MNLTEEQMEGFRRARREGFLRLHDYDPESHRDLALEWRIWCEDNFEPFVQLELGNRGVISYSLLRFSSVTFLTDAEIDELESFAVYARGSELPQCLPSNGHIGLLKLADAEAIARRVLGFCRAGIKHWQSGAQVPRYAPAQRVESA
jgi:hypothetical protein